MSWYYNYYLGYKENGKMYVLGPFDNEGNLHSVLTKSRSFASDLYTRFRPLEKSEVSEDIKKYFYVDDSDEYSESVKALPVESLPKAQPIQTGYVLIEDVIRYENEGDTNVFYNRITPTVYAAKLEHELKFGKNPEQEDVYGNKFHESNASEYMYYAWQDRNTEGYEAYLILQAYDSLVLFEDKNREYYILETEG